MSEEHDDIGIIVPYFNIGYNTFKGNLMEKKEIIVSKNKVYVLGDNTANSYESREFGMIDKKYLYGKIVKGLGSKNVLKDTWKKNNFLT